MKESVVTVIATFVLSLLGWSVFYYLHAPLKKPEDTLVLVGFCGSIVLFVKWVVGLVRNKGI